MSTINDLIQFADRLQRRKVEDRRYQDQRNMQLAQIAESKNKENQVIQGQRFFNDMTSGLMKSGWDDEGKWTGESPDTNKLVETYLGNMDSLGLAGDSALALERVGQFNQLRLQKAGSQLQAKVTDWEANNQGLKGEWYKPFDNTFEKDKKAYLKSINADKLYAQLMGLGGPAAAMETTGLTPDSFGKKADSVSGWDIAGGVGVVAAGGYAYSKAGAIKDAASDLISKSTDPAEKKLLKNIKRFTSIENVKSASRAKEAMSKAEALVKEYTEKYGKNNKLSEAIKGTKPSSILRNAKKLLTSGAGSLAAGSIGFVAAEKLASSMGDALAGEKDSKTGQVGGIVGGTAGAYAVPSMLKKVGSKINEKGASWALKKVMEKGGPKLAAKFALKAGLSGFGTVASSGWGAAGAAAFLAADLYAISQILSEDE